MCYCHRLGPGLLWSWVLTQWVHCTPCGERTRQSFILTIGASMLCFFGSGFALCHVEEWWRIMQDSFQGRNIMFWRNDVPDVSVNQLRTSDWTFVFCFFPSFCIILYRFVIFVSMCCNALLSSRASCCGISWPVGPQAHLWNSLRYSESEIRQIPGLSPGCVW